MPKSRKKELSLSERDGAYWKVNTPGLLNEILLNPQCGILKIPLSIFKNILAEVAERAIELNDPKLIALMCRLALYEQADPYSKDYAGHDAISEIIKEGYK